MLCNRVCPTCSYRNEGVKVGAEGLIMGLDTQGYFDSALHFKILHFPLSSSGRRLRQRDFNPCMDMLIFMSMSSLFIFLSCASRHAVTDHGFRFTTSRISKWAHYGILIHTCQYLIQFFQKNLLHYFAEIP